MAFDFLFSAGPTVSHALGYLSIACWLGAQLPQVIQNYRSRSCEGLALPFLINWMCGDATNFLGCILTDQLEFQKYLAGYFCCVDFVLLAQFYHYFSPPPPPHNKRISSVQSSPRLPSSPNLLRDSYHRSNHQHRHSHSGYDELSSAAAQVARAAAAVAESRRGGGKRSRSGSRRRKATGGEAHVNSPKIARIEIEDRVENGGLRNSQMSLRSNASVVRSASAGLGPHTNQPQYPQYPQQRTQTHQSSLRRPASWLPPADSSPVRSRSTTASSQNPSISSPLAPREVSFLVDPSPSSSRSNNPSSNPTSIASSPTSERGRTLTRPPPSSSTMPYIGYQDATPPATAGEAMDEARVQLERSLSVSNARGRGLRRQGSGGEIGGGSNRGKGAAGVVLLGVVGLVGVGRSLVADGRRMGLGTRIERDTEGGGRVLWSGGVVSEPPIASSSPSVLDSIPSPALPLHPSLNRPSASSSSSILVTFFDSAPSNDSPPPSPDFIASRHSRIDDDDDRTHHRHRYPRPNPAQTWQHLIGRVSAWLCTVLYLTSRMPQIWKNYTRKSTEGLSSILFIAAFCGNFTYVGSILTNPLIDQPRPHSTEYILEVLPFLIGSGGTLLFDITILIQTWVYSSPSSNSLGGGEEAAWLHHHNHNHTSNHNHSHSRSYPSQQQQEGSHYTIISRNNNNASNPISSSSRSASRVTLNRPPIQSRSSSRMKTALAQSHDVEAAVPLLQQDRSPSQSRSRTRGAGDLGSGLGLSFAGRAGGGREGGVAGWEREESGVENRGMMSVLEESGITLPVSKSNWPWGEEEPGERDGGS